MTHTDNWEKEFQRLMLLLCWEIEKIPASEQQTKTVLLAREIKDKLKTYFTDYLPNTLSSATSQGAREERERIEKGIQEKKNQYWFNNSVLDHQYMEIGDLLEIVSPSEELKNRIQKSFKCFDNAHGECNEYLDDMPRKSINKCQCDCHNI